MNEQDISKAVEAVLGTNEWTACASTGKDMSVGAIRTR